MLTPRSLIAQFGTALALLTRLPTGPLLRAPALPKLASCVWAFPLVGALVGAAGAAAFAALHAVAPNPVAAAWTLVALALLTGALHEDGLADLADGLGGGATRARKLEIMRDSRVGSYGVLALVLSVAVRGAALASLAGRAAPALVASGALSRAAMTLPPLLLSPARTEGLGAGLGRISPGRTASAWLPAIIVALLLLPAGAAAAALAATALSALGLTALARAQLGGFTGDVLGACAVAADGAVLTALAAWP